MSVRFHYYIGTDLDRDKRAGHWRFDDEDDIPNLPKNADVNNPNIITGSEAYQVSGAGKGNLYMFSEKLNDWELQ